MLIIKEMIPNNRLDSSVNISDSGGRNTVLLHPASTGCSGIRNNSSNCWELRNKQTSANEKLKKAKENHKNYEDAVKAIDEHLSICSEIDEILLSRIVGPINEIGTIGGKTLDNGGYANKCASDIKNYSDSLKIVKSTAEQYKTKYKEEYEKADKEYKDATRAVSNAGC